MAEKKSFWEQLFGDLPSEREEKVIEYIIHRLSDGAHLADVTEEEYVRRSASREEVHEICSSPRLIESARERMEEAFGSGELDPNRRPR